MMSGDFNAFIDNLEKMFKQLLVSLKHVVSASGRIDHVSQMTKKEVTVLNEKIENVDMVASTVVESADNVIDYAGTAVSSAKQAREQAAHCMTEMNQNYGAIGLLVDQRLQDGARSAVDVMNKSQVDSTECAEKTLMLVDTFKQISESIAHVNEKNDAIVSAVAEQKSAVEGINETLYEISDATEQMNEKTAVMDEASRDLASTGDKITDVVNFYNVGE